MLANFNKKGMCRNCVGADIIKKGLKSMKPLLELSDRDRIQTYNLLIRSQMLYSIELRSLDLPLETPFSLYVSDKTSSAEQRNF